jgi:hypothetical protein
MDREHDGLRVTMNYDPTFGLEVVVEDSKTEDGFILRPDDKFDGKTALDMFYHPFSFSKRAGTLETVGRW